MPLRAAIYARYSSEHQRDASIDDQMRLCREYAEAHGWEVTQAYSDAAISGASTVRPGYQVMLDAARRGGFDIVLAEALDRLSRDQEDVAGLYKRLKFAGIKLITVAEGEINELHVGLKGTMNALFLKDLAAKTHRGQRGVIEAGHSAGGRCFGYDAVRQLDAHGEPVRGLLRINLAEAATVNRIFTMFAAGLSPIAIARTLNAEQVPGPDGRAWRDTTIRGHGPRGTGILRNELYVGRRVWNRMQYMKDPATGKRVSRMKPPEKWITHDVPALRILDQVVWDEAQARLAGIRVKSGADRPGRPRFWEQRRARHLLTGKLFCGRCGGTIANVGTDYLSCTTARRQGLCDNKRSIRRPQLEALIIDALRTQLMQPELVKAFCVEFTAEWNRLAAERSGLREARQREFAQVTRKLDNLIDAIAGGLRGNQLQEQMDKLEARKAVLAAELATPADSTPRLHPALAEVYHARVAALAEALQRDDHREALDIARGLIERVTLTPNAEGGFEIELEGAIAAMIQLCLDPDAKSRRPSGDVGRDLFVSSVKVVAGIGFEPMTFRL